MRRNRKVPDSNVWNKKSIFILLLLSERDEWLIVSGGVGFGWGQAGSLTCPARTVLEDRNQFRKSEIRVKFFLSEDRAQLIAIKPSVLFVL